MSISISTSDELSTNESLKDDPAAWDYEAPQFCDFAAMETFQPDPETDKFFLTDHESKENFFQLDIGSESDCFQTPTSDNAKNLDNSDCQFFSAQKSQFDSAVISTSSNNNVNQGPFYDLRNTPLRSLYSNGATPLKEARKSQIFGRKSRKFLANTIKKLNLNNESLEKETNSEKIATSDDKTIDLSTLNDALDDIDKTSVVADETTTQESTMNVDETQVNGESETDLVDDQQKEDSDGENSDDTLKYENDEVEESEEPLNSEPCLPETETFDAKINDESANLTATSTDPINQSLNKSRRSSYLVVKSPVVSRSVRFSQNPLEDGEVEEEAASEVSSNVTPTQSVMSKTKSAIKNRKATPMFQAKTSISSANSGSIPNGRLARIKKYIKRFSKTPVKENEPLLVETKQVEQSQEDVPAQVVVESNDDNANVKPEVSKPTTVKVSKSKSLSFANLPTTLPAGKPNRLTVYSRKSRPLPTAGGSRKSTTSQNHLQQPTASTLNLKRFVSAAEMSMNFWSSSRQYNPAPRPSMPRKSASSSSAVVDGTTTKKHLTKPKSPKLLTQQRANHCSYHKSEQEPKEANKDAVDSRTVPQRKSTFKVAQNKENQSQNRPRFVPSKHLNRTCIAPSKKLTKAKTPVFCTEARRKQWTNKLNKQQQSEEQAAGPSVVFKARPAPDFKKLQAKNSNLMKLKRQQTQTKRNPTKINPFSFESRELARKLAKKSQQQQQQQAANTTESGLKTY